jgi:hypothetical protein
MKMKMRKKKVELEMKRMMQRDGRTRRLKLGGRMAWWCC